MGGAVTRRVAVVVPVHGNAATLRPLAERLAAALDGRAWRLRLVIDASPDDSVAVAGALAAADPRIAVSGLTVNVGQHAALTHGLAAEPDADAWVCLDADLQDPPEAVPCCWTGWPPGTSARCSPAGGGGTSPRSDGSPGTCTAGWPPG